MGEERNIIGFQHLPEIAQVVVGKHLFAEFGEEFRKQGVAKDRVTDFLRQNFQQHNCMVTLWGNAGEFLACASAVRIVDDYFVSNVMVVKQHRGKKLSHVVIEAAEAFCKRMRKRHVSLWCDKELVPLYRRIGYVWVESRRMGRDTTVEVLRKSLL